MGDIGLKVEFDTRQFENVLDLASRETRNALRRSVDRAARTARRETIPIMAADIGVSKSAFGKAVPPVKGSTQNNLSATWTISKARISALKVGKFQPVLSPLRGSYTGSTFRLSGGGSSSLRIGKSFVMNVGGNSLLMVRQGRGRSNVKSIYAEMPRTGMEQTDGAPRLKWQSVAERELAKEVAANVGIALSGGTVPTPTSEGQPGPSDALQALRGSAAA